jgi:hypothetical protein
VNGSGNAKVKRRGEQEDKNNAGKKRVVGGSSQERGRNKG